MREYLEKNYNADSMKDNEVVIKLAVKALLEVSSHSSDCVCVCVCVCVCCAGTSSVSFMFAAVPQVVQSGSQSIEMAVLETGKKLKVCVRGRRC